MKILQLWIPHHRQDCHLQLSNEIAPADNKGPERVSVQRTPPHTPSKSGQQSQHVAPPVGEPQIQPLASQDTDEESETVEPQSRISNRSTVLQSEENPQTSRKKTKAEVEKPNDPPIAKKHNSMDSDEDDEEPQNEPGTSSTSQPFVPVLPLNQGPTASSQGPAASANPDDENSESSDE